MNTKSLLCAGLWTILVLFLGILSEFAIKLFKWLSQVPEDYIMWTGDKIFGYCIILLSAIFIDVLFEKKAKDKLSLIIFSFLSACICCFILTKFILINEYRFLKISYWAIGGTIISTIISKAHLSYIQTK